MNSQTAHRKMNDLSNRSKIKDYLCDAPRPESRGAKRRVDFCLSFGQPFKTSKFYSVQELKQEPNVCARCICNPKRVLHIPFRTASACQLKLNEVSRCTEGLFDCMTFVVRFFAPLWRLPEQPRSLRWLTPGHPSHPHPYKPPAAATPIPNGKPTTTCPAWITVGRWRSTTTTYQPSSSWPVNNKR